MKSSEKSNYDLENRTINLGKKIIDFSKSVNRNHINDPLVSQLIRSGTSIGANYHEATEASSKKDFANKIFIAKKETKETKYGIVLIAHNNPEVADWARCIWKESQELNLIFNAIIHSCKKEK